MGKTYLINDIFFSLQGEGVRAGTANFFVRFTGCNLRCSKEPGPLSPGGFDCDTEFASGRPMTAAEILARCHHLSLECKTVIFTGGEPALQLNQELLEVFCKNKFKTCIETNGTVDLAPLQDLAILDWVTLSPKVAEHAVKCLRCEEVKYVRAYGQGIPKPRTRACHYLISPSFDGEHLYRENLEWCIKLVKENPVWRLSVQQHKSWQVS